eukprot:COSAG02_NODE_2403_length_8936_cov_7.795519_6_plen_393_part_00
MPLMRAHKLLRSSSAATTAAGRRGLISMAPTLQCHQLREKSRPRSSCDICARPRHRHYAGASGGRRSAWACRECGYGTAKWTGRCPSCGASGGDVFEEVDDRRRRGDSRQPQGHSRSGRGADPVSLSELSLPATAAPEDGEGRMRASKTTPALVEFDVVVGGGLMPGSLVLLGGEPGVGKTTLLLQVAAALARSSPGPAVDATAPRVLYASGEETVSQIVSKAYRLLGPDPASSVEGESALGDLPENLDVVSETSVERLEELLAGSDYAVAMIDSVQTCVMEDSASAAGSVATLRAVADRMMNLAKRNEITLVLAGHVTKDGQIAGPRLLEHLVDVVLYFDGSDGGTSNTGYRLLRCHKNRFGPTDEVGVFAMSRAGTEPTFSSSARIQHAY